MSDMAEYWKDVRPVFKRMSQDKRASNRDSSLVLLKQRGISCEIKNDGAHLVVKHAGKTCDFWPGTGKWIIRGGSSGRGVFPLVALLEKGK
jgi:hypothetical protein